MRTHLRIVALLWMLLGALCLLTGLVGLAVLGGIGLVSGKGVALAILGWLGGLLALTLAVLGLPAILVGRGLYRERRSARIPGVVLAILLALGGGAGVFVAAYMLWVLFDSDTRRLLGDPPLPALARA